MTVSHCSYFGGVLTKVAFSRNSGVLVKVASVRASGLKSKLEPGVGVGVCHRRDSNWVTRGFCGRSDGLGNVNCDAGVWVRDGGQGVPVPEASICGFPPICGITEASSKPLSRNGDGVFRFLTDGRRVRRRRSGDEGTSINAIFGCREQLSHT